jgi:hypothetical protein
VRCGSGDCGAASRWCGRLGEPEVQKLRAGRGEHDVAGLQVTVRDSAAMRLIQRAGNLCAVFQHLLNR